MGSILTTGRDSAANGKEALALATNLGNETLSEATYRGSPFI